MQLGEAKYAAENHKKKRQLVQVIVTQALTRVKGSPHGRPATPSASKSGGGTDLRAAALPTPPRAQRPDPPLAEVQVAESCRLFVLFQDEGG